jgi:hypothetical protein
MRVGSLEVAVTDRHLRVIVRGIELRRDEHLLARQATVVQRATDARLGCDTPVPCRCGDTPPPSPTAPRPHTRVRHGLPDTQAQKRDLVALHQDPHASGGTAHTASRTGGSRNGQSSPTASQPGRAARTRAKRKATSPAARRERRPVPHHAASPQLQEPDGMLQADAVPVPSSTIRFGAATAPMPSSEQALGVVSSAISSQTPDLNLLHEPAASATPAARVAVTRTQKANGQ